MRRTLSAILIILSATLALAQFGSPQGTSFTYQGQLRRSGAAHTGTCNFQFSLWNFPTAGFNQGPHLTLNGVSVVNGLFTVTLDFGDQFNGESRWLSTSVQCSGDPSFTALEPRQHLTAAPYALSLRPGASIVDHDTSSGRPPVLYARSFAEFGVGLSGQAHTGVSGFSSDDLGRGVSGSASGFASTGVHGYSSGTDASSGVIGVGDTLARSGVSGVSLNPSGYGVHGRNTSGGFAGKFEGPVDVAGKLTANSTNGEAITGRVLAANGTGVYGQASGSNSAGVLGQNSDSAGVWGRTTGIGPAVFGERTGAATGFAGYFRGSVVVEGTLSKGAGSFKIDHPLDPANKFLSHSFVESPDMMNIYNGNVTTDSKGSATITLPDYFDALNRDFRYQLTVLGQFAQAIVSRKIAGNIFEIRTDKPGVEVSWQVTGVRQDAYAKAHPIVTEEFKPAEEQGLYLFPGGFGAGEEKRIGPSNGPARAQTEETTTK